SLLKKLLD
nr:Chain D, SRC-1 peptide [Homo sapiens]4WLB_E Chain E, SRC-1 peptide [Homo sapiens]